MSELFESRCKDCSPKSFQCTPCAKLDVTVRKQMRQKKDQEKKDQAPVRLFPHIFPPMPDAAPLSINGQVMHLLSIASPNMGNVISPVVVASIVPVTPEPAAKVSPVVTKASPVLTEPSPVIASVTSYGGNSADDHVKVQKAATKAIPKVRYTPKATTKPALVAAACVVLSTTPTKRPRDEFDLPSEEEESDSDSTSGSGSSLTESCDPKKDANAKQSKVKTMPRITKEERVSVCDWIVKDRKDGKMLNGRWIRNGGAKGATMTATSSEVKTSGAYEALAL